ncbi:Rio1-like serine/threonine protein kinase [Hamiltosporidium magnivora]|uniref:non-specific serine/threonine protein kinase n=1 Tax=Hamiltosporidium magnivora TaxID=148818 RepID=A0A4Q9LK85_9MICR|nr:Rio1-like serine/threonine protein kinase [Hamiltosporidium magnivora]
MKLITDAVWSLSSIHLKLLILIEKLTKEKISISPSNIKKYLKIPINYTEYLTDLVRNKFLRYKNDIYEITISGYDCIAINSLRKTGLEFMGDKIGIGKESDIYIAKYKGENVVCKFHRLGRTSFRNVKNKRDYKITEAGWHGMSKASSLQEFTYLKMFYPYFCTSPEINSASNLESSTQNLYLGNTSISDPLVSETSKTSNTSKLYPEIYIPKPIELNRHVIVMEYLQDYYPLYKIHSTDPHKVFSSMINFIYQFKDMGYIHGDLNEFNILVNEQNKICIIDFPQCINLKNKKSDEYFNRDIECTRNFFIKKYNLKFVEEKENTGLEGNNTEVEGNNTEVEKSNTGLEGNNIGLEGNNIGSEGNNTEVEENIEVEEYIEQEENFTSLEVIQSDDEKESAQAKDIIEDKENITKNYKESVEWKEII